MAKVFSTIPTVSTPAEYDAIIEASCLPQSQDAIEGIDRHRRFESLSPDEIGKLNIWFQNHGTVINLRIDSEATALHILGAKEVDSATNPYNLERGKGKDKTYYWCEANQHNRMLKSGNVGDITRQGLIFDMVNCYWGYGPVAHIDAYGWVLSLQHRIIAWLRGFDANGGEMPPIELLTIVGMPPQLAATLDRGAPKTASDQEFIDREQFTVEFLRSVIEAATGEPYLPENVEKYRNELASQLVTVRNNLWSRLHGTGFHPSKGQSPSTRQAIAMQACFEQSELGEEDELQELIVRCSLASISESGKKALWASGSISPAMVACAIVLASNADQPDKWEDGSPIVVDSDVRDKVLTALRESADVGDAGLSSFVREIAKAKAEPKKPSGFDRWVFWGLVGAISALLKGEYGPTAKYWPNPSKTLIERVKKGKVSYPIFGGYDCGPLVAETVEE